MDQSHAHPAEHPNRQIEEDVLAVPFIAWLGVTATIIIVASVLALTGLYHQSQRALERQRAADGEALVTPAEAKVAADRTAIDGYYKGIPSPNPVAEGEAAPAYVSMPVSKGKERVLEQYGKR